MVDAGNLLLQGRFRLYPQSLQQAGSADLDAVAQTHGMYPGIPLHIAGQNGHGVGVVEQPGVGTNLLHVPGEFGHDGDGPQAAHDAADAKGVGDGLAQAVLFGDLEIDDGAGLISAHLDGVYHKICTAQCFLAVFHTQIVPDHSPLPIDIAVNGGEDPMAFLQAGRINIIKCNLYIVKSFAKHGVSQHIFGKNGASGAHKGYFHFSFFSF